MRPHVATRSKGCAARYRHAASAGAEHYCIDTVMLDYAVCEDYDAMTIKSARSYHRQSMHARGM